MRWLDKFCQPIMSLKETKIFIILAPQFGQDMLLSSALILIPTFKVVGHVHLAFLRA